MIAAIIAALILFGPAYLLVIVLGLAMGVHDDIHGDGT